MRMRKALPVVSGVPGVNAPAPKNFDEFYAFYLSQHLHPTTRRVHVAGMTVGWLSVSAAFRRPLIALGLPLFGYGTAIPSHYIWEKNKPALSYGLRPFIWAIGCDFRQSYGFYTGRLNRDVNEVRAALKLTPAQITLADAPELSSAA
jgi:hypothetical protein